MPVGEISDAAGGGDEGGDAAVGDAPGSEDAGGPIGDGCATPQLNAYQTPASGTVAGSGMSASFCGAVAWLYVSPYSTPPNDALLFLDGNLSSVHVESPPSSQGLLSGMMRVGAASPGVYTSAGSCGFLSFTFYLPPPPNLDCSDTSGSGCPAGCSRVCYYGEDCSPCAPMSPAVYYRAHGVGDCATGGQASGSWSITLTSVVPSTGPTNSGGTFYVVHGTVAGALAGDDGGSVNLTATF